MYQMIMYVNYVFYHLVKKF